MEHLSEADQDERDEFMFATFGGLIELTYCDGVLVSVIGYWNDTFDLPITIVRAEAVLN